MKSILEQIRDTLDQSGMECQRYFCEFLLDYKNEDIDEGEEVLCEFEDMDQYYLSPTFRYISSNGDVGTGVPELSEEGKSFFKDSKFMPENIDQQLSNLWESCEDEDKCYSFEAEIDELVKEWLEENWAESVRKTGVYTDLHYCKHHWNYKTINLSTKEERVLF